MKKILIYGKDRFRVIEKMDEYKSTSLFIEKFDVKSQKITKLLELLLSSTLFNNKKIIFVDNFDELNIKEKKDFLAEIDRTKSQYDVIVIGGEKVDAITIKKFGAVYHFDEMTKSELIDWIKKMVISLGGQIDASNILELILRIGPDLFRLKNTLLTIISFDHNISKKSIDIFVREEKDPQIFNFLDALTYKNKKVAKEELLALQRSGLSDLYILSMIIYAFRNLALVSFSKIPSQLNINPFVLQKTKNCLKNFSHEVVPRLFSLLSELDISIKQGKIDAPLALDVFIENAI